MIYEIKGDETMKVMKFGGSCLANANNFLEAVKFIEEQQGNIAIVLSAISGITDLLLSGISLALNNEKNVAVIIKAIKERHFEIANVIMSPIIIRELQEEIVCKISKLERLLYGVAYTEEITPSLKAMILSYGERFCVHLFANLLKDRGIKATALESDEIGIITDEDYEHATAILEDTRENVRMKVMPLMKEGIIPVITGYFGKSRSGKITTFGRNGTDYSAAVVAYALEASALEIWKDVDGFMSGDPKIVSNSHLIEKLSYDEAAELSYFGAKILHPRTVEPLERIGTPIFIKNVKCKAGKGTMIQKDGYEYCDVIKSVTCNRNINVLRVQGPGVGCKPGIIAEIGGVLSQAGINIYSIITSQTSINLLVDKQDAQKSYGLLRELPERVIENIDIIEGIALVAVVGEGLLRRKGVAARVFSAVAQANVNVEMISSGASEVAYYFIVKQDDVELAIKAIHKEFFANGDTIC